MGSTIEVFILEDHLAVRAGLELLLGRAGLSVAGVAGDVGHAHAMLTRRRFDVALIDINVPGGSGLDLVAALLVRDPGSAVVLYTGSTDPDQLRLASRVGARGFVLKAAPPKELLRAIRIVAAGGCYVDTRLAAALSGAMTAGAVDTLAPREYEILVLLADGLTSQEIAARLGLSPQTIRSDIHKAMAALGAGTRAQVVAMIVRARMHR